MSRAWAGGHTRIPLDHLVFLRNVPAGMDWSVIGLWVCRLRKTAEPCDPPIETAPIPGTDLHRVCEGRHRVIGAYISGRTEIERIPCTNPGHRHTPQ